MRTHSILTLALASALAGCGNPPCVGCIARDLSVGRDLKGADLRMPPADLASLSDLAAADSSAPPDMSRTPPDLAMFPVDIAVNPADLAGVDAAGFCDGTAVAGTCLQAVLAPAAACFTPTLACTEQDFGMTAITFCWGSYELVAGLDQMTMTVQGNWKSGQVSCMFGTIAPDMQMNPVWSLTAAGQSVIFDEGTGDVTCPDGTKTNVGANDGGCQALHDLLNPPTMNCQMGVCP